MNDWYEPRLRLLSPWGSSPVQYPPAIQKAQPAAPAQQANNIAEVFTPAGPEPKPDPWMDDADDKLHSIGIPAMKEEPFICLAYLQAAMGNVFGKLMWEHATQQLSNTLDVLALADRLPIHPRPVQTLINAWRRLGIDPDAYIIQYTACPLCWKHHSPEELKNPPSPDCLSRNCAGQIYMLKGEVQAPTFLVPHVSIIGSLRRMFMCQGFVALVKRKEDHQPGRNNNENFLMKDMPDGEMWYCSTTDTTRKVGSLGTVRDIPTNGDPLATDLFLHQFGLQLTLNTDWYVLHERSDETDFSLTGLVFCLAIHIQQAQSIIQSITLHTNFAYSRFMLSAP
jgi:hypothetical protein